jgi:NADH:ubiquinone oxidoreductase subunit 5 (subunit L)/multisubunit Na+/H+ antiporter MnhA subunit
MVKDISLFLQYTVQTRLIPGLDVGLSLSLAKLNYAFLVLVTTIGVAAHVYCFNYFKNEADEFSFSFWLNSFI